jgi:hypothetical protein
VVERQNLVQNEQIQPFSCLKTALHVFCCTCEQVRKQKCPAYVGGSCEGKQKTIQALLQRLANEQSSYARAALGPFREAVCWRFTLLPFSSLSLPSFSFLFLLSSALSPFCFQKPIWGSARQESSHTDCMGACEASLLRSEASKPVFW